VQVLEVMRVTASDETGLGEDFPHLLDEGGVWSSLIRKHFSKGKNFRRRDDAVASAAEAQAGEPTRRPNSDSEIAES